MAAYEVPTLPLLVPLASLALGVGLRRMRRHGPVTVLRATVAALTCLYGSFVLAHVLLPLPISVHDHRPWRVWLHLTPFIDVPADPTGMVLNVALFAPLGFLLPLIGRRGSMGRVVTTGFLVSLGIEAAQLIGSLTISPGRIFDVDDLVANTFGAWIGYVVYSVLAVACLPTRRLLKRFPGQRRIVQSMAAALSTRSW